MFKSAYQGGHSRFFSTQDKKLLKEWKMSTNVQKVFDKDVKGYIVSIEGEKGQMMIPSNDKTTLHLTNSYLVFQCLIKSEANFHLEIGVSDINKQKKRLVFHSGAKGIKVQHHHARIPIDIFKKECWVDLSINVLSFAKHCYDTKASAFNFKSIDSILIKGNLLIRKIFTMRNSLRDTDGYEDSDSYQIDEIPKTVMMTASVEHEAQVITAARILENSKDDDINDEISENSNQQNITAQSDSKGNYRYAFGSRVKMEEEFDKGLGIVGTNKLNQGQNKSTGFGSANPSESSKPKTATKQKTTPAPKPASRSNKSTKSKLSSASSKAAESEEEEKKQPAEPRDYSQAEKDLVNQKSKLDSQLNLVKKEEQKLEILRKKRKDLFNNPFKDIKEPSTEEIKEKRKREARKKGQFHEDMFDEEEVEEKPQAKEIDTKMHSIQEMKEEDEDCEHIGRGMRTGLSIEDDEVEDDFNRRDHMQFEGNDEREDIEDMVVAGTKTNIQYQLSSNKKKLNNDLEDIESPSNDYTVHQVTKQVRPKVDSTIPVNQMSGGTQFSVYYQSQINAQKTSESAHSKNKITEDEDYEEIDQNIEEDIPIEENEEEEIYENIENEENVERQEPRIDEDEEIEEGTFEDYEINNEELQSTSKNLHKKIEESKNKKDAFEPKRDLAGTKKYYPISFDNASSEVKDKSLNKEIANKNVDVQKSPVKLDKYSIRNKPAQSTTKGQTSNLNLRQKQQINNEEEKDSNFNPFVENTLAKFEGWATTAGQEDSLEINENGPDLDSIIEKTEDTNFESKQEDVISKDSLEEDEPNNGNEENENLNQKQKQNEDEPPEYTTCVYNSVLGLYYDPKTKQHFEVKPEDA